VLADLIVDGEVTAIYDRDRFVALVDAYRSNFRPMVEYGEA
jgi:hypothetical protein